MILSIDSRIIFLAAALGLGLFSQFTKYVISPGVNLLIDACVILSIVVSLNRIRFKGRADNLVLMIGIYMFFHFLWQLLTYGYDSAYNYNAYRTIFRGILVYFITKSLLKEANFELNKIFLIGILKFFLVVMFIDVVFEWTLLKVLGISLVGFLPWAPPNMEGNNIFGLYEVSRIPTLLGTPYMISAICVSLFFLFIHLHQSTSSKSRQNLIFAFFAIFVIFLTYSRLQVLILECGMIIFIFKKQISSRGMRIFLIIMSVVLFFTTLAFLILKEEIHFTSNPLILETISQGDFWKNAADFIVLSSDGIGYLLVGKGGVTGWQQYVGLINVLGIEAGIFEEMLQIYGLIFILLYYYLLYSVYSKIPSDAPALKLVLLVYFLSPLHFWTVLNTFHGDYFFLIVAFLSSDVWRKQRSEGY
jgi:hypothetical protein